ncbi:MAG: hypothetical protein WCK13_11640 [Ignavibacteriota bacterium]|nr:hypothetical protein [Ignavibacteriota bacterium]
MKNIFKILMFCAFYASLLNVFDNDAKQNVCISYSSESYSSASMNHNYPVSGDSIFDISSDDECFDEYIIADSHCSGYLKSNLFFTFLNKTPQKANDKIWHPPQNS